MAEARLEGCRASLDGRQRRLPGLGFCETGERCYPTIRFKSEIPSYFERVSAGLLRVAETCTHDNATSARCGRRPTRHLLIFNTVGLEYTGRGNLQGAAALAFSSQ